MQCTNGLIKLQYRYWFHYDKLSEYCPAQPNPLVATSLNKHLPMYVSYWNDHNFLPVVGPVNNFICCSEIWRTCNIT